jgi:hypothetical protein
MNGSMRFDNPFDMDDFIKNCLSSKLRNKAYVSSTDPVIIFREISEDDHRFLVQNKLGKWYKEMKKPLRSRVV